MVNATRMLSNLRILNACPWLLSKRMVVAMCKSIPITSAVIGSCRLFKKSKCMNAIPPRGLMRAKRKKKSSFITLVLLTFHTI